MTPRLSLTVATFAAVLAACGSDPQPTCLAHNQALMLPTPVWEAGAQALTPPPNDMATTLFSQRDLWARDVGALPGWPRRPTIMIALDGDAATSVDAGGITLWEAGPGGQQIAIEVRAEVVGSSLWIQPVRAVAIEVDRLTVAVATNAVQGATPLPACAADGNPHPGYAAAAADLPTGTDPALAVSFPLSKKALELPALYDHLVQNPSITVVSAVSRALADFGTFAPTGGAEAAFLANAVDGLLESPSYQDADGIMQTDGSGVPIVQGVVQPGFTVVFPATGQPPYPFVLYQHGGGQHRHKIFSVAGPLADAGFAVIGIDLPEHGDRGTGGELALLNFDEPLRTRDSLRQASSDHLAVLTDIATINTAIEQASGIVGALDANRAHYMGMSLGGISGTNTFASAPNLHAAAIFVTGAGYGQILSEGIFRLFLSDVLTDSPELRDQRLTSLALIEFVLDAADPMAYSTVEDRAAPPRTVLFFSAKDDPIVPAGSTDVLALNFGAQLARPIVTPVPGLTEVDLPTAGGFTWDGQDPSVTRVLIQAPMANVAVGNRHGALIEADYTQVMFAHCLTTLWQQLGLCEVIDTGFAQQ